MAKYLWRRPSGWVFQAAPPKSSVNDLGRTPFRISLGPLHAHEARRRACILAGYVNVSVGNGMSRESVSKGLTALAAELETLRREERREAFRALNANSAWRDEEEQEEFADQETVKTFRFREALHLGRRDALRSMRARLDLIGAEIRRDGQDWEVERAAYDRTVDRLSTMKGRPAAELPLLSVVAAEIIDPKADALGTRSGYAARLRRAVRAFVSIIGDRTVDQYVPKDLQAFTATLGQLPATWSTDKRLRDLTPLQVIERAKTIRGLKPISRTTVAEYLAEFRHIWKNIRATYPDHVRALGHDDVTVTLPRAAARPTIREGLDVEKINLFLARAATERRPDDRFLPLLGVLTGARLGELVGLQVPDLQRSGSHWIFNLIEGVEDEDGEMEERQVKTDGSRRIVALPDAIAGTGFLEWVEGLSGGSLWPQLSRSVRPSPTASKRLMRTMKELGIHAPRGQVFHSFRHGYKDWMRVRGIDKRTVNIQVGHAHENVGDGYGSNLLRPDEIGLLATVALPDGLDLSPYRQPFKPRPPRKIGRPRKT